MKPAENIEKKVKNLDLGIDTNTKADKEILGELLNAQKQSIKQHSAFILPNIRRFIMKNPVTKLAAAAAVIIAVLIGINHFGMSTTSVLWADVVDRFESVPFFKLTIYLGHDNSAEAKKIEIWKSEDSRIRANEENRVIFADFSNGKKNFVAFDKTTKEPANTIGFVSIFLKDLYLNGRFSLDTIIKSVPSDSGIKPVEPVDTAASHETVIFKIKHESTPEWLSIWALRESKLPVRMCFHDPRNNEYGDFFFDYSEPKDAQFFDPVTFKGQ